MTLSSPQVTVSKQVPGTAEFNFVAGRYALSRWKIPYFSTVMTLDEAAASLKLVNEFPGWERSEWSLEELFQREVDWGRVRNQIVPYLRNTERPQFFNSITVALLPILNGAFTSFDDERLTAPPIEYGAKEKVVSVGPLSIGYFDEWEGLHEPMAQFGTLRWNPRQVFCVAIDGQHRLAAIKQMQRALPASDEETKVPIILVVFDPRVGFSAPENQPDEVALLRSLFIDLNKHAVRVSRSRLILLDDSDPTSLCVRQLVGDRLTNGTADLDASNPRLPLSLIDWHSDSAKFDDGPYIATILGLDWIVQRAVGIKPISDYTDYAKLRSQIKTLERELDIDLNKARKRVDRCADVRQKVFSYDDGTIEGTDELSLIAEGFKNTWATAIVTILRDFSPYRRVIDLRKNQGSAQTEFVQWYQLRSRTDGQALAVRTELEELETRMGQDGLLSPGACEKRLVEIEREKADGSLAFNVVFQRALFLSFAELKALDSRDLGEVNGDPWAEDPEDEDALFESIENDAEEGVDPGSFAPTAVTTSNPVSERARDFISALNDIVLSWPEFLDVRVRVGPSEAESQFWLGTLLKAEGSIDFTIGASGRAKHFVSAAVLMQWMCKAGEISLSNSFGEFWVALVQDESLDSPLARKLRASYKGLRRGVGASRSAAGRMVADGSSSDAEIEALRIRYEALFSAALKV